MSRAMMSPPITPPPLGNDSITDVLRVKSIDSTNSNDRLGMKRSDSLMSVARGPLQNLLARFKELEDDLTLSSLELKQHSPSGDNASLSKTNDKYMKFLTTTSSVLEELDAEDDIEFALSNRDLVPAIEASLSVFRKKIADLVKDSETRTLHDSGSSQASATQMIKSSWSAIEGQVAKIKIQVSASGDWGDCQESLDAIDHEEKDLRSSIFLMEEQRHVAMPALSVDLDVLATILEEPPEGEDTGTPDKKHHNDGLSQWDRSIQETILKLTGKISPLKASLSMFAPRLDAFAQRAEGQFPSAVASLSARYQALTTTFDELIADFVKLRSELAEDKWMAVFRQVNKQATEMMNSLERTLKKLDGVALTSAEALNMITSFEMKAEHYGKSIPAVLAIMQRGVRDRATLNGEILRGYDLLTQRWAKLSVNMADMSRRIQGARGARILQSKEQQEHSHAPRATSILSKSVRSIGSMLQVPAKTTMRVSPRRSMMTETTKTPSALSRSVGQLPTTVSRSPTPLLFRKDTSLDPPRSISRLGYSNDRKSMVTPDPRPPWNAGTAVRLQTSGEQTPTRPASRIAVARSGAMSSLGQSRSQTPSVDRRRSLLPTKSPRKSVLTTTSGNSVPPMPATPSQATIDRLSKPKIAPLGVGTSRLVSVPPTPSALRSSLVQRPKTPTAIPVSRRIFSSSETTTLRPKTTETPGKAQAMPSVRSSSVMGSRRQSNIPMPSPRKSMAPK